MAAEEFPLDPRVYFDTKLTAQMKCNHPILHELRAGHVDGGCRAMDF
jgi:hypothetical protein